VSGPAGLANSSLLRTRQSVDEKMPELRIMPLGASITQGIASSPQNGTLFFFVSYQ
jgi:hypothetical protein